MALNTYRATTETVDRIIDCAAGLFKSRGYKNTTVDEIAARLAISKKTLYAIFPAKDAILSESAWRDMMFVMKRFSESSPDAILPETVLLSLCRFVFTDRIKSGTKGLFWGIYAEDNDIRMAYFASLGRIIHGIYCEGSKSGAFKPIDPSFGTELIVAIIGTALDSFSKTTHPAALFNDALSIIADSIAFKERLGFDRMG